MLRQYRQTVRQAQDRAATKNTFEKISLIDIAYDNKIELENVNIV